MQLDWQRVKEVFAAACELPAEERAEFVRRETTGDPDLRQEVLSLLPHHRGDECETDLPDPPEEIAGFIVRERIGRGGMGVVHRAEQTHPRRDVALKILARDVHAPRARRRFEHEADLLARLQHPGIAQVFAAGVADTTSGPLPYLAMELIDGDAIDVFARRLDLRARCELLARIADAVHHAHLRSVVHCDLKPGNVLVDASGQPKVLDFGIARALEDEPAQQRGSRLLLAGTLAYMSPEQTAGNERALDARVDVYALGAIAYELLSGRLPLDLDGDDLLQALARIRGEEPTPLAAHDRLLRGDLATIVHKALAKDRETRYASAAELAEDLRRFLRDEPISARPPSTAYVLRKYARRHAAVVAGLGVAGAALLLGALATLVGFGQAARADTRAGRAKEFLRDHILSINPDVAGGEVKLLALMEAAADDVGRVFADDALGRAEMQGTIAATLRGLGAYDRATPLAEAAYDTLRTELGAAHAETHRALAALGVSLARQGRREAAAQALRSVLLRGEDALTVDDRIGVRSALASVLADLGEADHAETEFATAAALAAAAKGVDSLEYRTAQASLADQHVRRGAPGAATDALRQTIAGLEAQHGEDHPAALQLRYSLATSLATAGATDAARIELERLLPLQARVLGDDHPATRHSRCSLAIALVELGRDAEAEAVLPPRAVANVPRDLSEAGLRAEIVRANLLARRGRTTEAARIARDAADDAERVQGPTAPLAVEARSEEVHIRARGGDPDAGPVLDALLPRLEAVLDRRDTLLSAARLKVAAACIQLGRAEAAEAHLRGIVDSLPPGERERGPWALQARSFLLFHLLRSGRLREAADVGDALVPALREVHGDRAQITLQAMHNHAGILRRLERFAEALPAYRECLAARSELQGAEHPDTRTTRMMLTLALVEAEEWTEATEVGRELLAIEQRVDPAGEPAINARVFLARTTLQTDPAEAAHRLQALVTDLLATRPLDDGGLNTARAALAEALLRCGRASEAEPHARADLDTHAGAPDGFEAASARLLHARCLAALDRHAEAEAALSAAARVLEGTFGLGHSRTRLALTTLAAVLEALGRSGEAADVRARLAGK